MTVEINEIAERMRTMREILELSVEDVAKEVGVSAEEYAEYEKGNCDFSFTFLLKCAECLKIDFVELLTGDSPRLSSYTVVRSGTGLPIERRAGFHYQHLAYLFKRKIAEPFLVTAPYRQEEQEKPIMLSSHEGQEFDFILKGSLKVAIDNNVEILNAGDTIYYNSAIGHGMIATGGEDCVFLTVVMKKGMDDGE